MIKLDHQQVVQTSWKPTSQQCWDHRASIDLDRVNSQLYIYIYIIQEFQTLSLNSLNSERKSIFLEKSLNFISMCCDVKQCLFQFCMLCFWCLYMYMYGTNVRPQWYSLLIHWFRLQTLQKLIESV